METSANLAADGPKLTTGISAVCAQAKRPAVTLYTLSLSCAVWPAFKCPANKLKSHLYLPKPG